MTRLLALTLILALAGTAGARAQGAPSPVPLPLERVMREALTGNASLRAATSAADVAAAGVAAARSSWYPRVSVSESWQRGNQPIFVFSTRLASRSFGAANFAIDQLNHPGSVGYFHGALSVEQVLFDGGARRAGVDGAHAEQQVADLSIAEARLGLAADVTETYGRLLAARTQRRAAVAALEAGREDLARAASRRDAGMATEADVLALAVHVADMEQRVIQADGDAVVLRAQINRLAGAPIDRDFDAVEPAPDATRLRTLPELLAEAAANRPGLKRVMASVQAAQSGERAARAAFAPRAAAQAAFDVSGTRVADRASAWIVGGEVRWTLALGGAERARLTAAVATTSRARAEAEDAGAQVQVDVITAFQQVQSARARQAVGQAAVAQAQESQRIIRDRYDAGLAPVSDVLSAATVVLDAEARRVSALVDELTARARMGRATGQLP